MKFMMLVKHGENSGPPPKELMDAIAILSEEAVKKGTMLGSGGLAPTAQSTRVRLSGGRVSVIDGPFTEAKEGIGGGAGGVRSKLSEGGAGEGGALGSVKENKR